jgi:hypothetical protein
VVKFERFGGASGVVGVAAIATQYVLVGTATPDKHALLHDRVRWEYTTLLRIVGGLGIIWFTAGLAGRLGRLGSRPMGPATILLGAGLLWGWVWLVSALFNSVAIVLAASSAEEPGVHVLTVLGTESVLVLTPTLAIAFLVATGVAVLATATFPRRYGYMTLASAGFRVVLAIVDWYGAAELAMRIMDFTLLWVVVTAIHLLGATRPAQGPTVSRTMGVDAMKSEPGRWDRIGASAGIWAVVGLGIGYAITRTTTADLAGADADYVHALLAERTKWEWVTFVRLVGGALVLWFMGSLAGRLRLAEGEPGRLATAAFALGVVWAGVWLLSAFFNSASILLAANYGDPAGSRIAGVLARETPYVLTGSVVFALLLATSFVALRFGGFPKAYTFGTTALTLMFLVLAVADWYGPGTLSSVIVGLALLWTAATSALLVPAYRPTERRGVC